MTNIPFPASRGQRHLGTYFNPLYFDCSLILDQDTVLLNMNLHIDLLLSLNPGDYHTVTRNPHTFEREENSQNPRECEQ